MANERATPSARQRDLLERAYQYVLDHGLTELSLRPLASSIGSSPRVLLYLFDSKDGLIRALLARARADELALLERLHELNDQQPVGLEMVAEHIWAWLAAPEHRPLLGLWVEGYGHSLTAPASPWGGFAQATVEDWLALLAAAQPPEHRDTPAGEGQRTLILAILRGALMDLLATGDAERTTAAVRSQLATLRPDHTVESTITA